MQNQTAARFGFLITPSSGCGSFKEGVSYNHAKQLLEFLKNFCNLMIT